MEKELIPQVIVETQPYQRAVQRIWDSSTQVEFKNFIGLNPEAGDVIPGTGGIRKRIWAWETRRCAHHLLRVQRASSHLSPICVS